MTPPTIRLSLSAAEEQFRDAVRTLPDARRSEAWEVFNGLVALLQPFARMYHETPGDGVAQIADTCPITWYYDMYGTDELTAGHLRQAAQYVRPRNA